MSRPAFAALWLVLCLGTPLRAQTTHPPADSTDVLVLDHDFSTIDDLVWVFLKDRQVYRAELSTQDFSLQIRSRFSGVRPPRVYPILEPMSASGSSVVEIYPDQDGEYEIRPIRVQGSRVSTRVRLYRDVSESRRRLATASQPGWELGIELAGGWHSGFAQSSAAPPVGSDPIGGTDLEGCFSARNAPGLPRLNLCVLGLSHQSQRGGRNILWVYTEPRVRILGRAHSGRSNWEVGALLRFGVGIISAGTDTPTILGPGIYVARHIRRTPGGAGWSLQTSYSHSFFKGFEKPLGASGSVTPTSHRVSFGVGWYQ